MMNTQAESKTGDSVPLFSITRKPLASSTVPSVRIPRRSVGQGSQGDELGRRVVSEGVNLRQEQTTSEPLLSAHQSGQNQEHVIPEQLQRIEQSIQQLQQLLHHQRPLNHNSPLPPSSDITDQQPLLNRNLSPPNYFQSSHRQQSLIRNSSPPNYFLPSRRQQPEVSSCQPMSEEDPEATAPPEKPSMMPWSPKVRLHPPSPHLSSPLCSALLNSLLSSPPSSHLTYFHFPSPHFSSLYCSLHLLPLFSSLFSCLLSLNILHLGI